MASINVDPDLGKPIINIGIISLFMNMEYRIILELKNKEKKLLGLMVLNHFIIY